LRLVLGRRKPGNERPAYKRVTSNVGPSLINAVD
jgi:hypothetical protein